ncbi:hypothetical protein ACS0TY_011188 [Phlomoides rotata]
MRWCSGCVVTGLVEGRSVDYRRKRKEEKFMIGVILGKVLEFQRSWMRHKLLRAPQSRNFRCYDHNSFHWQ